MRLLKKISRDGTEKLSVSRTFRQRKKSVYYYPTFVAGLLNLMFLGLEVATVLLSHIINFCRISQQYSIDKSKFKGKMLVLLYFIYI